MPRRPLVPVRSINAQKTPKIKTDFGPSERRTPSPAGSSRRGLCLHWSAPGDEFKVWTTQKYQRRKEKKSKTDESEDSLCAESEQGRLLRSQNTC